MHERIHNRCSKERATYASNEFLETTLRTTINSRFAKKQNTLPGDLDCVFIWLKRRPLTKESLSLLYLRSRVVGF
ncbi:hypothetical protein PGB90_002357 [Kerria lacca]